MCSVRYQRVSIFPEKPEHTKVAGHMQNQSLLYVPDRPVSIYSSILKQTLKTSGCNNLTLLLNIVYQTIMRCCTLCKLPLGGITV